MHWWWLWVCTVHSKCSACWWPNTSAKTFADMMMMTDAMPYKPVNWATISLDYPDSKVHGANMGPIWGRQDPGGPHVGPMNFAIWVWFAKQENINIQMLSFKQTFSKWTSLVSCHDILNHQQLNCLINSIYRLPIKKTAKLCTTIC